MQPSKQVPHQSPSLWNIPQSYLDQSGRINDLMDQLKGVRTSIHPLINAAEHFDWHQPGAAWAPCFHLGSDGYFCGRAPWWDGHTDGSSHIYTSLADLLRGLSL